MSHQCTITPHYAHTDHLFGSSVMTSSTGTQDELVDYYPFGEGRVDTLAGSFKERHKFTGHLRDEDTGLEYAKARYLNTKYNRFISQDKVFQSLGDEQGVNKITEDDLQSILRDPQGLNSYAYARNNPFKYVDHDGNWYKEFFTGQQSWGGVNGFQMEIGQSTQHLTNNSQAWSFAVDHPVATGAITAVASVPALIVGESAAAAYGMATFPGVGATFATQQAIAGTIYSGLTISSTLAIPQLVKPFSKADINKPSSFYPAALSVAKEVGLSVTGRQIQAVGGAVDVMQVGGMIGKVATNLINNLFSSDNSQKSSNNMKTK